MCLTFIGLQCRPAGCQEYIVRTNIRKRIELGNGLVLGDLLGQERKQGRGNSVAFSTQHCPLQSRYFRGFFYFILADFLCVVSNFFCLFLSLFFLTTMKIRYFWQFIDQTIAQHTYSWTRLQSFSQGFNSFERHISSIQ